MKHHVTLLLMALLLATLFGCGTADSTPSFPYLKQALKSMCLIKTTESTGSGFVAYSGQSATYIVTAYHVVDTVPIAKPGISLVFNRDQKEIPARLMFVNKAEDLALMVAAIPGGKPWLRIARKQPEVGTLVALLGNPWGVEEIVTFGRIAANGTRDTQPHSVSMIVDIKSAPGFSGGCVINEQNEVVGLHWGSASQTLALSIPTDTLRKFVYNAISIP